MFFFTGYIKWGNFGFPLQPDISNVFSSITWDPYTYNGLPVTTPWISIFGYLNNLLIIILGGSLNLNVAVKLYVVISTFFMTYSFYVLTGRFAKFLPSRIAATAFILLNPVTLQSIGLGNFFQFIIWGIYFLSLVFLSLSLQASGSKKMLYLFISVLLLSLTVPVPQIFYIGIPLYILFILYFLMIEHGHFDIRNLLTFLRTFALVFVLLILLSMPFILTSLFGAFNLSPHSPIANPLNNFIVYSVNFFGLLEMQSFPMLHPVILLGEINNPFLSKLWSLGIDALALIILSAGIVLRDKRMIFMDAIIFIAALLGSDYLSPVSGLTVYLYTHMLGYQVLNDSFFWEWLIITPLYGILLSMLIDRLLNILMNRSKSPVNSSERNVHKRKIVIRTAKFVPIAVVFIVIFIVLVPPVVGQGYYGGGNSGIHQDNVPASYNLLADYVEAKIGNSQVGVAYFTPDNVVIFGNTTDWVSQPLFAIPVRSAGIPTYGAPPVESNYFFYWAYTEFYLNKTDEIAQIMSLAGIKYFVTLNDVKSVSFTIANDVNATKLMSYQKDVKLLYSSGKYSIFESTLDVNAASKVSSFTIMSGNYDSLLYSAALGLNISRLTVLFPGDINSSNFNFIINNTSSMVFLNSQSFISLAIDRFSNSSNGVNPLIYTDNYYYCLSQGWAISRTFEWSNICAISTDPYTFAITSANKPMSINLNFLKPGNYTLWAYVLDSPDPDSSMEFNINGESTVVNTSIESAMGNFTWVKIPVNVENSSVNLKITSLSGINGIERIVLLKRGAVSREIASIEHTIDVKHISVLHLDKNGTVQLGETGIEPLGITLRNSQNISTGVYQQFIQIPMKYLLKYANSDLSNVQWQYTNGTIIPSWLQSYNSLDATWWLKVSNIPANGSLTIYLVFFAKDHSVLNSFNTGESSLINPSFDDGRSVFNQYNSTSLIGSGTNIYYPTNKVGFYFYTKFYNPSGIPGNAGLVGWSYEAGIDTPMFIGLSNTTYLQPYYWVNGSGHLLEPHLMYGSYYLLGTGLDYPEAFWFVNNTDIATANSTYFTNYSATYVRPTGVNISVLYSFMTTLPPNGVMPSASVTSVTNIAQIIDEINNNSAALEPLNLFNNPNGYTISGNIGNITLVRYGYFSGMIETVPGFREIPILGGLCFVLISSGTHSEVTFLSKAYYPLVYGVILYAATITCSSVIIAFSYKQKKKKRG